MQSLDQPPPCGNLDVPYDLPLPWIPTPHVHALVRRGGWGPEAAWTPLPYIDQTSAAALFRHEVFHFLRVEGLPGLPPPRSAGAILPSLGPRHPAVTLVTPANNLPEAARTSTRGSVPSDHERKFLSLCCFAPRLP